MSLNDLSKALLTVTENVKHLDGTGMEGNYIVWAEDGVESLWADGRIQEQSITGTIDYFTKLEYDPDFEAIQAALSGIGASYKLNSIQYEKDTEYIHYEWIFEVA